MDLERQFSQALFPLRYYVLGVEMAPFTLGHAFLLRRIGSPFVAGGEPSRGDLLLAMFICSRPWQQAERQMQGRWFRWWCRFVPTWGMLWKKGVEQIGQYLRDGTEPPRLTAPKSEGGRESSMSVVQLLYTNQKLHWRKSKHEALSTTVLDALWDWGFWLEMTTNGAARFETESDVELEKAVEKLKAELAA